MSNNKLYIVTSSFSYNVVSDYLKNIAYGFKKYGDVDVIFLMDKFDLDEVKNNPVIYLSRNFLNVGKREYMLNLCQIFKYNDIKSHLFAAIQKVIDCNNTIIDFSSENIKNINFMAGDKCKKIIHFPYIHNPNDNIFSCAISHVYDVCIVGALTPRRKKIYDELLNRKIKVIHMDNVYGQKRDENICRSKMLLNLHSYDEANIIESIRCNPVIFKKILIISEESVHDSNMLINRYIIYKKYEDIVDSVIDIMNNYIENYNKIYGNMEDHDKSILQLNTIMMDSVHEFMSQNSMDHQKNNR